MNVCRVLPRYMLAQGMAETGIFIMPNASGLADGGRHCTNWFDIVEFGHKDAYNNALAILALEAAAEVHAFLGNASRAAFYAAAHSKAVSAFNAVFWQAATPVLEGAYADWIDVDGNARAYAYVDVDLLAIIGGVANQSQAIAFLQLLDRRYAELAAQFKLSSTAIWSVPCSLFPLASKQELATDVAGFAFPGYEQGGSFFREVGYVLASWYHTEVHMVGIRYGPTVALLVAGGRVSGWVRGSGWRLRRLICARLTDG